MTTGESRGHVLVQAEKLGRTGGTAMGLTFLQVHAYQELQHCRSFYTAETELFKQARSARAPVIEVRARGEGNCGE